MFNHCDIIGLKICRIWWKKTQNKTYYGVQDHLRSSGSVPIESPYATYQWLIVTDLISCTVSELSQLIVKFRTLCVFEPPFGRLRDNVPCSWAYWKACSGLPISVNWTFLPGVTAESYFAWRKSATKFLCVKTVSGKVVRHSLA